MKKVRTWGGLSIDNGRRYETKTEREATRLLEMDREFIPLGNGRNYGDGGLGKRMISWSGPKELSFDSHSNTIRVSANVTFNEVLAHLELEDKTLSVVPGHGMVTMGGAVAADVHGKNHCSQGSFSSVVKSVRLLVGTGEVVEASRDHLSDLFWCSFGAMGLTGMVLSMELYCRDINSLFIVEDVNKGRGISDLLQLFENAEGREFKVAWLDLARPGVDRVPYIFRCGDMSETVDDNSGASNRPTNFKLYHFTVPFNPKVSLIRRTPIRWFNGFYYGLYSPYRRKYIHYRKSLMPLDALANWNLLYGNKGLHQFQFVVGEEHFEGVFERLRLEMHKRKLFCSLAVLKRMGLGQKHSPLSFPMKGYSLAMDFPRSQASISWAKEMTDFISRVGGRVYLAKDAILSESQFKAMYPKWTHFQEIKNRYDPEGKWVSKQSQRLNL